MIAVSRQAWPAIIFQSSTDTGRQGLGPRGGFRTPFPGMTSWNPRGNPHLLAGKGDKVLSLVQADAGDRVCSRCATC